MPIPTGAHPATQAKNTPDIPEECRLKRPLRLPAGLGEPEVRAVLRAYAGPGAGELPLFRGAGAYRHHIPAVVEAVAQRLAYGAACGARREQDALQCVLEYQNMLCALTGMAAAAAPLSDGAAACVAAMRAMCGATGSNRVLASAGLHPEYLATLRAHARFGGMEVLTLPLDPQGVTSLDALEAQAAGAAGAILQSPNFLGNIEALDTAAALLHGSRALLTACVNPIALGLLASPGALGADFAVGEGQPLGVPLNAGGPYLGFMAARDARGLPGYVAQEAPHAFAPCPRDWEGWTQACLRAPRAAAYLAAMGPEGLRQTAMLCLQHAHYLRDGMLSIRGMRQRYPDTPFFHEFVMECGRHPAVVNAALRSRGFVGGLRLGRYDRTDTGVLYCATERNTREEIDAFLNALEVCAK